MVDYEVLVGAYIEAIEAVILFISLLCTRLGKHEVSISWKPAGMSSGSPQTTYEIEGNGFGSYFLDGTAFLQKLYALGKNFRVLLQGMAWPTTRSPVQLVCRRMSELACFSVEGLQHSNQLLVRESSRPLSADLSAVSLSFTISVCSSLKELQPEAVKLAQHIHLLHIINPQVAMKLEVVSPEGEYLTNMEHSREDIKPLLRTPFRLSSSLYHYQSVVRKRGKVRFFKGDPILLPTCVPLREDTAVSANLLLYCAIAMVPQLSLNARQKIKADQQCSCVHITVFGPAMLPLMVAGSLANVLPSSLLANWSDYGLALEEVTTRNGSTSVLVPSFQYVVVGSSESQVPTLNRASKHHTIHLFLFFEETRVLDKTAETRVSDMSKEWAYYADLTASIRRNFSSLLSMHTEKFNRAVHSAMDKLFYNYTSQAVLSSRVDKVVSTVADAVASIIDYSTNQEFKNNCKDLLQVERGCVLSVARGALADKLSAIARKKFDLEEVIFSENSSQTQDVEEEIQAQISSVPVMTHSNHQVTSQLTQMIKQDSLKDFESLGSLPDSLSEQESTNLECMEVHSPDDGACYPDKDPHYPEDGTCCPDMSCSMGTATTRTEVSSHFADLERLSCCRENYSSQEGQQSTSIDASSLDNAVLLPEDRRNSATELDGQGRVVLAEAHSSMLTQMTVTDDDFMWN